MVASRSVLKFSRGKLQPSRVSKRVLIRHLSQWLPARPEKRHSEIDQAARQPMELRRHQFVYPRALTSHFAEVYSTNVKRERSSLQQVGRVDEVDLVTKEHSGILVPQPAAMAAQSMGC